MNTRIFKCTICGKTAKRLVKRWFQYDNGETFAGWVCTHCSDLHASLLAKAGA